MKEKIWTIFLIVIVFVILLGVVGIKLYNKNVDDQISEGAKKEAVRYFKEKKDKEFIPTETIFNKQMGTISVDGYFKNDPEQKYYASMIYYKTDDGYTYDVGSTGEILGDNWEEWEQEEREKQKKEQQKE